MRLQFKNTIQIKDVAGKVLFEYTDYDNTVQKTLEKAAFLDIRLTGAVLTNQTFYGANFKRLNLHEAVLNYCAFQFCDLSMAIFVSASLRVCGFGNTQLKKAVFADSFFDYVAFDVCTVHDADFRRFKYHKMLVNWTNMDYALNVGEIPFACPKEGSFEAYKIVKCDGYDGRYIVKLLIPEDAKRSSSFGDQCRCDKAQVLEVRRMEDNVLVNECINNKRYPTIYRVGEMVYADKWDDCRWNDCTHGIHFFMDEEKAKDCKL